MTFTVEEKETKNGHARVCFSVKDQGAGISQKDQKRIFRKFEQLDNMAVRQQGTGLGLAISNRLIHMMGSEIQLESEEGKGSCFSFELWLPLAEPKEESNDVVSRANFAGVRVLAVEKFAGSQEGFYELILMDVQMPVMNGLEAAHRIRMLERSDSGSVPIIAVSANAFEEDVRRLLASGMNAHLSKPIEVKKLAEVMKEFLVVVSKEI